MGYKHSVAPYAAMLQHSERKAMGYGVLALVLLISTFIVTGISSDGAGRLSPMVEQVRHTVGLGLLCGSGLSVVTSIWFICRYVYFFKWPERFD